MLLSRLLLAARDRGLCSLALAHIHHGLRPEADEEEEHVRTLASRWGLELHVARLDVPGAAARTTLSPEQIARRLRYRALAHLAVRAHAPTLAVGHHQDDQAETVLLRILRGTGPRGLGAMAPAERAAPDIDPTGEITIIRPHLSFRREELRQTAVLAGLRWMEDASNALKAPLRNRIRHTLLPLLAREYNPRIVESLCELAHWQRAADDLVEAQCRQVDPRVRMDPLDVDDSGTGVPPQKSPRGETGASIGSADNPAAADPRSGGQGSVGFDASALSRLPVAVASRLLWTAYQQLSGSEGVLSSRHMRGMLSLIGAPPAPRDGSPKEGAQVHLPGGIRAVLKDGVLRLEFHAPRPE